MLLPCLLLFYNVQALFGTLSSFLYLPAPTVRLLYAAAASGVVTLALVLAVSTIKIAKPSFQQVG